MYVFEKEQVENAVKGSGGIMSTIAKRLGCSWYTAKKAVVQFELESMVDEESESILDLTESMLIKNIQGGDVTSIIYMLNTKGKKRGYGNKQEIDHTTNGKDMPTPQTVIMLGSGIVPPGAAIQTEPDSDDEPDSENE